MDRTRWDTVVARADGEPLLGGARLAALVRWLRGEPIGGVRFFDAGGDEITDPRGVHWGNFPLKEAVDAMDAQRSRPR